MTNIATTTTQASASMKAEVLNIQGRKVTIRTPQACNREIVQKMKQTLWTSYSC